MTDTHDRVTAIGLTPRPTTMPYRHVGRSGLMASALGIGCFAFGGYVKQDDVNAVMSQALDMGINYFDTANSYGIGKSEEALGMSLKGRRDQALIATKFGNRMGDGPNDTGASRLAIIRACEASLRRLGTDYIDLYQLHWPDRTAPIFGQRSYVHVPDEDTVPIDETLDALKGLVQAGKIRHFGVSNETPWGLSRFLTLADYKGLPRAASIQNAYSLVNRHFELGLSEIALREECGLLAYSPLGFGVLSGKYLNGARPEGARLTLFERFSRYNEPGITAATAAYVALFRDHGLDPAQAALAFVNSRDFVTANIIGATTMAQLQSNIASIDLVLPPEVLAGIEQIQAQWPNPAC